MTPKNRPRKKPTQVLAASVEQDAPEAIEAMEASEAIEAIEPSETVVDVQPQSATDRRFHEARMHEADGDLATAIAIYRDLLLDNPNDLRVRNNLGCLYEKRGDATLALEQFEAARAVDPENVAVLL